MSKYKHWDLFDTMPEGWKFCKNIGSPLHGYEFASNGLSILNGGRMALVRTLHPQRGLELTCATPITAQSNASQHQDDEKPKPRQQPDQAIAKTVNDLARARLKQKLLADILVDLTICEIEGWPKMDYIKELQNMLNEIGAKHT